MATKTKKAAPVNEFGDYSALAKPAKASTKATRKTTKPTRPERDARGLVPGAKVTAVFEMITREGGATTEEITAAANTKYIRQACDQLAKVLKGRFSFECKREKRTHRWTGRVGPSFDDALAAYLNDSGLKPMWRIPRRSSRALMAAAACDCRTVTACGSPAPASSRSRPSARGRARPRPSSRPRQAPRPWRDDDEPHQHRLPGAALLDAQQ